MSDSARTIISASLVQLKKKPLLMLGLSFSLFVIILYLLSPDDPSTGLPSPYTSRYMWTPLIPISICLSVSLLMASAILGQSNSFDVTISVILFFILILLSPQFAEFSPLGVDGWWFVEIGERYARYGVTDTESYTQRMLLLIPYEVLTRVFPGLGIEFASLVGFLMSIYWILLVSNQIKMLEPLVVRLPLA